MPKILRDSHLYILENLPAFVQKDFVFSGGTALAEYYFHHRRSDDLDFFCLDRGVSVPVDAILSGLSRIGQVAYERIHDRALFSVQSRGETIKVEFCPLYFNRLRPPITERHGYLIDSMDDIAANKILALCGRNEPKDFVDVFFFHKIAGYDLGKMIALADQKERQAYRYLVNLGRVRNVCFDVDTYKIITDFSETELKTYFYQQEKAIAGSMGLVLDEDDDAAAVHLPHR